MCEELSNVAKIENESDHTERHKDRGKMEQIVKGVTFVLDEEKIKVEGETKGKM